ncbi:MAG TPA: succinate dehydrogenase, cytochrome b556 subunit [Deinococcales bacterium]|nr:succinate dehydrogenase, cytochrome b556 subunit [Deinococcales bacterium]
MYRGREGQWAFTFHRISGWALALYLLIHTFSMGSILLGEHVFESIHGVYGNIIFRLGLIAIAAAVVYHALNGLRIILMDFTSWGVKRQNQLWWAVMALTLVSVGVTLYYNAPRILQGV